MSELLDQAAQALRDSGGRMTAQRRTIIEALERIGGHPTAEEIYDAARNGDAEINPSTVYRTLSWLEQAGLLSPTWLGSDRCRRQEPLVGALPAEHHHFVCNECGQIVEFSEPLIESVKTRFAAEHGAHITRATLIFYGLCSTCQAELSGEAGERESAGTMEEEMTLLSTLRAGGQGVVRKLTGERAFCSRAANLGFTEGAEVEVIQNYGHGPLIVAVRGTRVALGRTEAASVLVATRGGSGA
ncbi:MAG TPA: transcriptional repressor [Anaerolineae bacterium]